METVKCDRCGQELTLGFYKEAESQGIPAMLIFQTDKKNITLCCRCIARLGELTRQKDEAELDEFYKECGVDPEDMSHEDNKNM